MKAFFLVVVVVVVSAVVAEEAVKVEQPAVLENEGQEVRTEEIVTEATAAQEGQEGQEVGSRSGAVDIGERSAVPAAPVYPYPYSAYYWPHVPLVAPVQLARSDVKGAVAAVAYHPYAYTYPYYTPVVAAPPAPAPPVGASVYYGNWQ